MSEVKTGGEKRMRKEIGLIMVLMIVLMPIAGVVAHAEGSGNSCKSDSKSPLCSCYNFLNGGGGNYEHNFLMTIFCIFRMIAGALAIFTIAMSMIDAFTPGAHGAFKFLLKLMGRGDQDYNPQNYDFAMKMLLGILSGLMGAMFIVVAVTLIEALFWDVNTIDYNVITLGFEVIQKMGENTTVVGG